ncbi:ANTAR domain-containing response regulator [Massilia sp. TS11]|uniref:ANTAR domain-containing response regulator n=1 Tax=Massilia sp. TS11 TaxID=2908003 RepID=UPI001EDC294B|nr:response regulator [Massilia sp. TS11]MCG2584185.1 response regulator [Massilia sp. TS11]
MKRNTKPLILIVDDDPLILSLLGNCLRMAGYEVAQAQSGEAALDYVAERLPDLVSIDVEMGGMSGLELAQRLKSRSVAFMFVSAHAQEEIVARAKEHGAVGYLLKPFEVNQVVPAYATALEVAGELRRLRENGENLTAALNAGRETSMAVGLLMRAYQTNRIVAFDALREYARANRRKINDVAAAMLDAEELFNDFELIISKNR